MHKDPAYRKKQHDQLVEWFNEGKEEQYIDEVFGSRWQLIEIMKGFRLYEENFYYQWYNTQFNDDPKIIERCDFIHPGFPSYDQNLSQEQRIKADELIANLRGLVTRRLLTYDNLMVHPRWAFKWAAEMGLLRVCEIIAIDFMSPYDKEEKLWGPYVLKADKNTAAIWTADVYFNTIFSKPVKRLQGFTRTHKEAVRLSYNSTRFNEIYANYKGPVMAQSSQLPLS